MFSNLVTTPHKPDAVTHQQPVRVLYIDDEEVDRLLMKRHVKRHLSDGVELDCVGSPYEAANAVASKEYDYIVTDNRMPPISNYRETLDIIDLSEFDGRVILVSIENTADYLTAESDDRLHCVIDKVDLSQEIKDGLFAPLHAAEAEPGIDLLRRSMLPLTNRRLRFA